MNEPQTPAPSDGASFADLWRRRAENEMEKPRPPSRRRRIARNVLLVLVALAALGGWREYTYREAMREVRAAGFIWTCDDPIEIIQKDWSALFRRGTWTIEERDLVIRATPWDVIAKHREAIERLHPRRIFIKGSPMPPDMDILGKLKRLPGVLIMMMR